MTAWPPGSLLAALDPADRAVLLGLGTRRTYRAGTALMHQGSADAGIFAILEGYAKVFATAADGRTVLLSIRVGGDLVGELAALDDKPRSASVVAATRVVAQAVSQRAFLRYLEERPSAAKAIHGAVVAEFRWATSHRVEMNGAPTAVRLAFVLSHLMASYGRPCADGVRIDVPLSQPELASLVGVSEPTLHRCLTDLRARDIVRTRYRHLIVTDPGALQALDHD
jgi:CRP-like cAMP-binding protein